jgi:2-C-methyl-D-erythritol 4-phosphate cytidylyltransferase
MDSIAAVICAAGTSARMGGEKKEYRLLPDANGGSRTNADGLTVLGKAVSAFAEISEIKTIVIAVCADSAEGEAAARKTLPSKFLAEGNRPAIHFVGGGATRQASVFNALSLLAAQDAPDLVLIHDGARPWVSPSLIRRVIAGTQKYRAVIPLLPLTETPKETDAPLGNMADGVTVGGGTVFIKQHLRRAVVGAAQTPQGFAFPEIFAAHQQAAAHDSQHEYTDDAEVWAAFCGPVAAIPGENENRKITFPEDLHV